MYSFSDCSIRLYSQLEKFKNGLLVAGRMAVPLANHFLELTESL